MKKEFKIQHKATGKFVAKAYGTIQLVAEGGGRWGTVDGAAKSLVNMLERAQKYDDEKSNFADYQLVEFEVTIKQIGTRSIEDEIIEAKWKQRAYDANHRFRYIFQKLKRAKRLNEFKYFVLLGEKQKKPNFKLSLLETFQYIDDWDGKVLAPLRTMQVERSLYVSDQPTIAIADDDTLFKLKLLAGEYFIQVFNVKECKPVAID